MTVKNFDAERLDDWHEHGLQQMQLGGEIFTIRPVIEAGVLRRYDAVMPDMPDAEVWEIMDDVVLGFILPQQRERWFDVRKRTLEGELKSSDPTPDELYAASLRVIDVEAVMKLMPWLIELAVGRPLDLPNVSGAPTAQSDTSSTDGSTSQEPTPEPSISEPSSMSPT